MSDSAEKGDDRILTTTMPGRNSGDANLAGRALNRKRAQAVLPTFFIVVVLLFWQVAATSGIIDEEVLPGPSTILAQAWDDRSLILSGAVTTATAAFIGWILGAAVATALASVCVVFPGSEAAVTRVSLVIYGMPIIALAPLLNLMVSGTPAEVIMAALLSFFPVLVAALVGLRSVPQVWVDLIHAAGGGQYALLRRIRLGAVVPGLVAGLQAAAPAAIAGAIVVEFMGGVGGLGSSLLIAQQQHQVPRTWALGLVTGLLTVGACWLAQRAGNRLGAAAAGESGLDSSSIATVGRSSRLRRIWSAVLSACTTIVIVLAIWVLAVRILPLTPLVAKGPEAVWGYLVTSPSAAEARIQMAAALRVTLIHAGLGLVLGLSIAACGAVIFALSPLVRRTLLPLATILRAFPIVALTPLLVLVFGRGLLGVALIGGMIVFFPSLVILTGAIASVPSAGIDLVKGSGGNRWAVLRYVQLPAMVPAVFGAIRVGAPLAIVGALVAEWLATGDGLGKYMVLASTLFQYTKVWAAIAVVSALTVLIYSVVAVVERVALKKFSPANLA